MRLIDFLSDEERTQLRVRFDDPSFQLYVKSLLNKEVDPVQHGRWISCSERLPDKEGRYLCTVGAPYRNPREMIYAPDNFINNEDSNTWRSTDGHRVFNWFVIAWMPLPKPWKMDEVEE